LQKEREAEAKAERAAEAQAKYLAVMAAYETEIAQHAAAAPRTESGLPPKDERENGASASESDSHNSRNSGAAEPPADSDAPAHPTQQATTAAKRQQAAAVQGVAGGHGEEMHFSSVSDSHNSRNSPSPLVPEARDASGSLVF
jgi:hypothetical protein